jgi:hypothetical protein
MDGPLNDRIVAERFGSGLIQCSGLASWMRRGVAAIYVAIFHLALVSTPLPDVPQWLRSFVYFGGSGVTLFLS